MKGQQQILHLAEIYGDGMVLQRDTPLHIAGQGGRGTITACLNGVEVTAPVENGEWALDFPAMPATESCTFAVRNGDDCLTFQSVAIGEIWLAGGQSNMDFKLYYDADFPFIAPTLSDSGLRLYSAPQRVYDGAMGPGGVKGWEPCTPQSAAAFSAVGYYFGRRLREELGVPVGIISCAMGGTNALCWIDESHLLSSKTLAPYWQAYQESLRSLDLTAYFKSCAENVKNLEDPIFSQFFDEYLRGNLTPEKAADYNARMPGGLATISSRTQVMGPAASTRPAGLIHTMLEPLAGYPIKGVIFYQGESDAPYASEYGERFALLVQNWRDLWGREVPFFFTQLAGFERDALGVSGEGFEEIRRQQQNAAKLLPSVWMISAADCGCADNIHPNRKKPVGQRLAAAALHEMYGRQTPYASPSLESVEKNESQWQLRFSHANDGLTVRGDTIHGLKVFDTAGELSDFTVAVQGPVLTISARGEITRIEFANAPYTDWNFYSRNGLPVLPFIAED